MDEKAYITTVAELDKTVDVVMSDNKHLREALMAIYTRCNRGEAFMLVDIQNIAQTALKENNEIAELNVPQQKGSDDAV